MIETHALPLTVVVPEMATAGAGFEVVIHTLHQLSCEDVGRTEVTIEGAAATVTPYILISPPRAGFCPSAVVEVTRRASITFETAGLATVTVRGLSKLDEVREIAVGFDVTVTEP